MITDHELSVTIEHGMADYDVGILITVLLRQVKLVSERLFQPKHKYFFSNSLQGPIAALPVPFRTNEDNRTFMSFKDDKTGMDCLPCFASPFCL